MMHCRDKVISVWVALISFLSSSHTDNSLALGFVISCHATKSLRKTKAPERFFSGSAMEESQNQEKECSQVKTSRMSSEGIVDIGINLTHRAFRNHWREVVQRAIDGGVATMILTGTSLETSRRSLQLAQQWFDETGSSNLYCTVGIHPHDAKSWNDATVSEMKQLLQHPLAVSVGECGLDYNRNFSSRKDQLFAFREQVKLAVELKKPLFVHEREAHNDLLKVFDEFDSELLPPIVVHCFTGSKEEAIEYIQRGYYIGFTGTICKHERGASLRDLLPSIPLEKVMVETDAPFMGFQKGRRSSEPADCIEVARKVSEVIDLPFARVCEMTTSTACNCFGIK
eukprot:CCRYP_006051-RA/>CCRYP_006051-RA protein AED:0.04 eAED:0.04 QI:526/1/1/1/0.5/0.33/3/2877/340